MDISGNVDAFMISYRPDSRHTSFDYCFNYFQSYRDSNEIRKLAEDNMELSYLQIGFYLASWGMFRSGLLRTRSSKQFEPLVQLIAETPKEFWDIDMGGYDDATCEQLVEQSRRIIRVLSEPLEDTRYPTKTVATKVMLGVFGNVPAFDRYVRKGLSCQLGVSVFGVRALKKIGCFYRDNAAVIDSCRPHTLDFRSGKPTERLYTRAKLMDMLFYVEGGAPRPATA